MKNWKSLAVVAVLAFCLLALVWVEAFAGPPIVVKNDDAPQPYWGSYCLNGLPGDANCDCEVNGFDYWNFVEPFLGATPGTEFWRPRSDLNRDGIVSTDDGIVVSINLGRTCLHVRTGTEPGPGGTYWNVTELADGTPWPPTFCTDSGACWTHEWRHMEGYAWRED